MLVKYAFCTAATFAIYAIIGLLACSRDPVTEERRDTAPKLPINLNGSLQNAAFSPQGDIIVFTRFHGGGPGHYYQAPC